MTDQPIAVGRLDDVVAAVAGHDEADVERDDFAQARRATIRR
jgi:hypothetical protein